MFRARPTRRLRSHDLDIHNGSADTERKEGIPQ